MDNIYRKISEIYSKMTICPCKRCEHNMYYFKNKEGACNRKQKCPDYDDWKAIGELLKGANV